MRWHYFVDTCEESFDVFMHTTTAIQLNSRYG